MKCVVCLKREGHHARGMCWPCENSWIEKTANASVLAAIHWAAKRARRFALAEVKRKDSIGEHIRRAAR